MTDIVWRASGKRKKIAAVGGLLAAVALGMVLLAVVPADAAFPGKNGKIAFMSNRVTQGNPEGDREIFTMSASGKRVVQLTSNGAFDLDPAFSANGKKIVFVSRGDTNFEIYTMNADGSGQKNISNDVADDTAPAFSPDGKRVVFASDRTAAENPTGDQEIFTMKPDGTDLRQLTANDADDDLPVYAPNGRKIAFTTDRDGNEEIYTMDASGGNPVNLTQDPGDDGRPDWSPDGKKIVFQRLLPEEPPSTAFSTEVFVMKANGDDQTRLTSNTVDDSLPVFSPDGRQIAFHSSRDGNAEIYRMKLDGSLQTMVSDETSGGSFIPDWQPLKKRR